jgi:hypothetical protein
MTSAGAGAARAALATTTAGVTPHQLLAGFVSASDAREIFLREGLDLQVLQLVLILGHNIPL